MTRQDAIDELRANVAAPFERAHAMPKSVYTSDGFAEAEVQHIFARDWLCAGRADALTNPGDYLTMTIDGVAVDFLADTGASTVVLSDADARLVGIDPDTLAYLGEANTANGTVQTADVSLKNVSLGPFEDATIRASVTKGAMAGSLLGMNYLGLYRIEIDQDKMILSR